MGRTAVRKIGINHIDPLSLLGQNDQNLRLIEDRYPVSITLRDATLSISGDQEKDVERASQALHDLVALVERGGVVEDADVHIALGTVGKNDHKGNNSSGNGTGDTPVYVFDRKTLRARSPNQAEYLRALEKHDIVFAIGPAGTGKTYLAVAAALHALRRHEVERIILTRPAVEAGESLGYLPGDMQEKVDPYLRPLYDALQDFLPFEKIKRFMELGVIEIAPLAFMRGRTLHKSFVILDEAQNTTVRQMKMFLTRLGSSAKAAITGDITQIDLDNPDRSGLVQIQRILSKVPDISFVYFGPEDVVRHRLVRDILRAFQEFQSREAEEASPSDTERSGERPPQEDGSTGDPGARPTAE
jgi:phosphate starvation-inducible PhoH-like protein